MSSSSTPPPEPPSNDTPIVIQNSDSRPLNPSIEMHSTSISSSAAATPAPTPIIKCSARGNDRDKSSHAVHLHTNRKRNFAPSSSLEISQDSMAIVDNKNKNDSMDESDTDVGSSASGDLSYKFDCEDVSGTVNPCERTPEISNSSYSLSKVGAKVRRLDLGGGDVKQASTGRSKREMASVREPPVQFHSPPASPPKKQRGKSDLYCPRSTAKNGPVSRILLSSDFDGQDDDESPRDAAEFPFFTNSPPRENGRVIFGEEDVKCGDNSSNVSVDELSSYARDSPQCPPSTMKKPNHGRNLMSVSPPKNLRTIGRANSFLQMFSHEDVVDPNDHDFLDDDSLEAYTLKSPNDLPRVCPSHLHQPMSPQCTSSFSRFVADFEVAGTLGNGSFGCVYKVRSRIDRRMYAIKAAKREARGASDRDQMLQEVFALAALSDQTTTAAMHIVRYHQAWMEGNRLYIQTELCDGNLEKEIAKGLMDEMRSYKLLREMSLALDLVHKSGMIHLDIKPENIFIKNNQYKLGDFGLVSKIENHNNVEEGDSRYMSMELLSGDLEDLTKSDIFSLGATMYEICLGKQLPENGQEWQDIRHGILLPMTKTSYELQMIVRSMLAPEKESRPTADGLLKKRQLLSDEQRQLIVERNKANEANLALDRMQRLQLKSPRKRFHRCNTVD